MGRREEVFFMSYPTPDRSRTSPRAHARREHNANQRRQAFEKLHLAKRTSNRQRQRDGGVLKRKTKLTPDEKREKKRKDLTEAQKARKRKADQAQQSPDLTEEQKARKRKAEQARRAAQQ